MRFHWDTEQIRDERHGVDEINSLNELLTAQEVSEGEVISGEDENNFFALPRRMIQRNESFHKRIAIWRINDELFIVNFKKCFNRRNVIMFGEEGAIAFAE